MVGGVSQLTYQGADRATRAGRRVSAAFAALPAELTFTVDVEGPAIGRAAVETRRLMALLEAHGSSGTFFLLDEVVREVPGLVREISARGHEVASHGAAHVMLATQAPTAFRAATTAARDRLSDLLGAAPRGYRAPFFSLTPSVAWVPEVLAELGFLYSSSVLPAPNPLAGWPGAPTTPFRWPCGLLELPVPVGQLGPFSLPFLGGMYLRWLPLGAIRRLAADWAARHPAQGLWCYCHPYDIDAEEPFRLRRELGVVASVMLRLNRRAMLPRLKGLLEGRQSRSFAIRLPALCASAPLWCPDSALFR